MENAGRAGNADLSKELLQVLGVQDKQDGLWDASTPLSASDLRALVNRMQLRSEQVKDRVRRCVLSQKEEFACVISTASASLNHFLQVAQDLEPLLTPGTPSQDPSSVCSQLSAFVEQVRLTNREVDEKKQAIHVVERIANLFEMIKTASLQLSQGKIAEAAQVLLDAKHELGLSGNVSEEADVVVEEEDIRPYALLKQQWLNTFTQMSGHLEELFRNTVLLDAKNHKLHIRDGSLLFAVLTAMDKIGLLGTTFAKLADNLMKTVIGSILQGPLEVKLSEDVSTTGDAVLSWVAMPNVDEDAMLLAMLYTKLLKVVHFLHLYVSCGHGSWTKELGRFIWPRMADAIISGYLSKAVPNEVSEVAKFQESANLTFQFERSLSEVHLINDPSPSGDKLGKFAADVEVHFVSKKKSRIIARVRRLLVRFDFSSLYKDGKRASRGTHASGEQNRMELLFQPEHCVISHAAKQLVDIVHGVLADACVVAAKMSLELYHAARDAFLLYAAIVPVKLAKELKELSLEAIVHHNDCLYLAHESLALNYQYGGMFPAELKETCMFVDLFPLFQELANKILKQQLLLSLANLNKALDEGNGFRSTHEVRSYEMASLSLDQIVMNLEKVRMLWKPVMVHSIYASSMGYLMTSIFGRIVTEILDIEDLDHRECGQLHELILALDDRMLPLMQSLVDTGMQETTGAENIGSLNEIGKLVPTWCKLLRLSELLNMPSTSIAKAWENGSLVLCGFSSTEVQNLIRAMFQDSEKRKESLKRLKVQQAGGNG
ncbi:hypothetical protein GOP47_0007580 [Adiantum capillus-veneris]|uniref:Centromere/kinetochore protein zw10 n=1 Tax=Adiantum capillus-veneris TaxID=13818 RepID=A0A9D4ZLN4_ADICA|nr:hypothetical protein GOP47_0007580 [Adiantum capillus-veneris]